MKKKTKPEVERSNGQAATSSSSPSSTSSSSSWCLVRSNSTLNCRHFCQSFVCLPRPTNTNWRSFILPHAICLSKASRTMPYQNNSWHDIKAKIKKKKNSKNCLEKCGAEGNKCDACATNFRRPFWSQRLLARFVEIFHAHTTAFWPCLQVAATI